MVLVCIKHSSPSRLSIKIVFEWMQKMVVELVSTLHLGLTNQFHICQYSCSVFLTLKRKSFLFLISYGMYNIISTSWKIMNFSCLMYTYDCPKRIKKTCDMSRIFEIVPNWLLSSRALIYGLRHPTWSDCSVPRNNTSHWLWTWQTQIISTFVVV